MKGLAFVYDPDGYWVEIVKRGEGSGIPNEFNFSQTMLRVKDPNKSLAFYKKLGMKVLVEKHFDDFSLFFLGSSNVKDGQDVKTMFDPVLELTHNHGTENDDDFKHFNGNEQDKPGFGHIGFLVDDVYKGKNVMDAWYVLYCYRMSTHNTQLAMVSVKWDMAFARCVFHCLGTCVP